MQSKKYSVGQVVEVRVLGTWNPAYIEDDLGGGWYLCNLGLDSDMFASGNIRSIKNDAREV